MWFAALRKGLLEKRVERIRAWRRGSISIEERLGAGSQGGHERMPVFLGAKKSVALVSGKGLVLHRNMAEGVTCKAKHCASSSTFHIL